MSLAATNPVAVSGSGVTLTLAEAVRNGDTVTVAYTAPGTGAVLQDADNAKNPVPDFTAQTVTNNTPVDTTAPSFVSASMNGTTLTVDLQRGAGRERPCRRRTCFGSQWATIFPGHSVRT